jgi:hypothetical protein
MITIYELMGLFDSVVQTPVTAVRVAFFAAGAGVNVLAGIPKTTTIFAQPMDPADKIDFIINCSDVLETDESIATFTLALRPEASALGLQLGTDVYAASVLEGKRIRVWLSIDPQKQGDLAFESGAVLPFEVTINSNSVPPRRRQRTVAVKVVNT